MCRALLWILPSGPVSINEQGSTETESYKTIYFKKILCSTIGLLAMNFLDSNTVPSKLQSITFSFSSLFPKWKCKHPFST